MADPNRSAIQDFLRRLGPHLRQDREHSLVSDHRGGHRRDVRTGPGRACGLPRRPARSERGPGRGFVGLPGSRGNIGGWRRAGCGMRRGGLPPGLGDLRVGLRPGHWFGSWLGRNLVGRRSSAEESRLIRGDRYGLRFERVRGRRGGRVGCRDRGGLRLGFRRDPFGPPVAVPDRALRPRRCVGPGIARGLAAARSALGTGGRRLSFAVRHQAAEEAGDGRWLAAARGRRSDVRIPNRDERPLRRGGLTTRGPFRAISGRGTR